MHVIVLIENRRSEKFVILALLIRSSRGEIDWNDRVVLYFSLMNIVLVIEFATKRNTESYWKEACARVDTIFVFKIKIEHRGKCYLFVKLFVAKTVDTISPNDIIVLNFAGVAVKQLFFVNETVFLHLKITKYKKKVHS